MGFKIRWNKFDCVPCIVLKIDASFLLRPSNFSDSPGGLVSEDDDTRDFDVDGRLFRSRRFFLDWLFTADWGLDRENDLK